jgi:cyclophilin family peptidyl-prolyl cis-trans isomerase
MRVDKAKVVDEVWDDARIASFLDKGPMGNESESFSRLLHAYRSMRGSDFARFMTEFKARGGDPSAKSSDGRTLLQLIERHERADEFKAILAQA